MDINDLNKSQLLLLAILLSFITSIATGITTVTLMEQAPTSVTVPINRIIQQTVEKIVPVPGKTTNNTVVVKEEDLVVDAISKNQSGVFSISKKISRNTEGPAGRAFAVSSSGVLVADSLLVSDGSQLFATNSNGKFDVTFIKNDSAGFAYLQLGGPVNEKDTLNLVVPATGDLSAMKTGQKVLVFGSSLTSFIFDGDTAIKMSINPLDGGSVVLNLDGQALGIALSGTEKSFAPISAILASLPGAQAAQ